MSSLLALLYLSFQVDEISLKSRPENVRVRIYLELGIFLFQFVPFCVCHFSWNVKYCRVLALKKKKRLKLYLDWEKHRTLL